MAYIGLSHTVLQGHLGISKNRIGLLPVGTLSQTLDLKNFIAASLSCCQQNSSTVDVVDDYDGRCAVAVYYTSANCNSIRPT